MSKDIYGKYFKKSIDSNSSPSGRNIERIQPYLDIANEQFDQKNPLSEPIGAMLYSITRFSAWSVSQHCLTQEELIDNRNTSIDGLCELFRKKLEGEFDNLINQFSPPEDIDFHWRNRFSVKKLESELEVNRGFG